MLFKPTQSLQKAQRRLRLTTKQASVGGGYYKGTGVGSMGWHTKHGGYIIDLRKVRTYVPPQGGDRSLQPFVPNWVKPPKGPEQIKRDLVKKGLWTQDKEATLPDLVDETWIGGLDGQRYLDIWKDHASQSYSPIFKSGPRVVMPGEVANYEVLQQINSSSKDTKKTAKS